MNLRFDTKGNEKQKEACRYWIDQVTEEILYGGAKYGGKSVIGCNLIFGDAMMYPGTRYFIARDSLTDLRRYTIPSVFEVFGFWGLDYQKYIKYNGQDNYFKLYNDSVVEFIDASFSPSDPDYHRFGSRQYTRGWCEEIGDMDSGAIKNLMLTIGRWKNVDYGLKKKLLMTCNPHKGYGYQEFYKPAKEGLLAPNRKFIIALPSDNKAGDQAYIDSIINNPDKDIRERLGKGNWEYDDDPAVLIPFEVILSLFTNPNPHAGRRCITADIARLGGDRIVRIEWDGFIGTVYAYDKQKLNITTEQIDNARTRMALPKSSVLVDADGMGSGVEDFGGFKGFNNGARPMPDPKSPLDANGKPVVEHFDNLKSQCAFRMADRMKAGQVKLICTEDWMKPLIIQELEQWRQKIMFSDMKKGLVPKDEVKEKIGRSPDFSDAILMREWFELKPVFVRTATRL